MWMRITKGPVFSISNPTQFLISVAKFASKAKAKAKARAKDKAASSQAQLLLKNFKAPPSSNSTVSTPNNIQSLFNLFTSTFIPLTAVAPNDDYDELDIDWVDEDEFTPDVVDLPWSSGMSNDNAHRKEVSREKKHKFSFSNLQTGRFEILTKVCSKRIEPDTALVLLERMGQEPKLKDYTAFIKFCIEEAKAATNEEDVFEQIHKTHQIFTLARANHFEIHEEMYGPFLMFLVDYGLVDEFDFFSDLISDGNPGSIPRLAYYQMLLCLRVDNKVKTQELCHSAVADISQEKFQLREQLLLALCEGDRKEDFLMLLQTFNITEITSVSHLESVFRALGKFLLEPLAERFVLALKSSTDIKAENISNLIWEYAISMPNLSVEDVIKKFHHLHAKLAILITAAQYAKLIGFCCNLHKVHEALNIVDKAFESGVSLSLETFNSILDACNRSCELNLVHKIKSTIHCHNLNPNLETYRRMILLYVKMKNFEGAYELISDFKKVEKPVAGLYNIILSGFYREKNIQSARNVLKRMEDEGVKPDALTFSYLIANSNNEKDIIKFYEQMSSSGILPVKPVYMALIKAYAACGQFDKAKEVLLDKGISEKSLNELKNVLIGALASNGQFSCALKLYEDVKKDERDLDPKAIKALIDYFESEGDLNKMLVLLEDLNHSPYWVDSCFRVISYCVKQENLRFSADLIKKLKDKFIHAQVDTEVIFDEVFVGLAEKTTMQFGLNLLKTIKEELGVSPTRKSLDFLLNSCVNAKDANACFIIWKEYETAGLPYNVLSYVRMYQALLASGDKKSAVKILREISREDRDDPHVRSIISACDKTYREVSTCADKDKKKMAKKKTEKNEWEALSELF